MYVIGHSITKIRLGIQVSMIKNNNNEKNTKKKNTFIHSIMHFLKFVRVSYADKGVGQHHWWR